MRLRLLANVSLLTLQPRWQNGNNNNIWSVSKAGGTFCLASFPEGAKKIASNIVSQFYFWHLRLVNCPGSLASCTLHVQLRVEGEPHASCSHCRLWRFYHRVSVLSSPPRWLSPQRAPLKGRLRAFICFGKFPD